MTIQDILNKFEAKGPPWGSKLTPSSLEELNKFLIDFSYTVYVAGYKQGKKDTLQNIDERGDS